MHQPAHINAIKLPINDMLKGVKYIDYDYKAYGDTVRRSALLKRWDAKISALPR